jgi:hypothetical protein
MAAKKPAEQDSAENAQPSDPTRCGGYVLTNEGWKLAEPEPDED